MPRERLADWGCPGLGARDRRSRAHAAAATRPTVTQQRASLDWASVSERRRASQDGLPLALRCPGLSLNQVAAYRAVEGDCNFSRG